jgi:patatin-like phospholipase/acyl hydrolase
MSPNVSDYEQTLPAYVCRTYVEQCVNAHPNDLEGITTCRDTVCGNKTIDEASSSSSSSQSSSATGSSTRSGSGSSASQTASSTGNTGSASQTASQSASSTADSSAASALHMASNYGTGLLAVGILAAFGLAL